jgi:hypothetical protein
MDRIDMRSDTVTLRSAEPSTTGLAEDEGSFHIPLILNGESPSS